MRSLKKGMVSALIIGLRVFKTEFAVYSGGRKGSLGREKDMAGGGDKENCAGPC
jgi:predicted methyltransferase MtxX (methanogen marker protein 4)